MVLAIRGWNCLHVGGDTDLILGVFYRKSLVKTGKPIVVSNGRSEIYTDHVTFENLTSELVYNNAQAKFPAAARFGTTTPLLIEIQGEDDVTDEDILKFTSIQLNKYLDGINLTEKKRIKERIRYRKNNPSSKHHSLRKEIIQN